MKFLRAPTTLLALSLAVACDSATGEVDATDTASPGDTGDTTDTGDTSTPGDTADTTPTGIGPAGGSVTSDAWRLDVPAGALASPVVITLAAPTGTVPGAATLTGAALVASPAGQTFMKPATLSVAVPNGVEGPHELAFYDDELEVWVPLRTTVAEGRATARVDHFTTFGLRSGPNAVGPALDRLEACQFSACGTPDRGAVLGTWRAIGACSASVTDSAGSACQERTGRSVTIIPGDAEAGDLVLGADGAARFEVSAAHTTTRYTYPASCVSSLASCAEAQAAATCYGEPTAGCTCEVSSAPEATSMTGTWTFTDGKVVISNGQTSTTYEPCAQTLNGERLLSLREVSGTSWIHLGHLDGPSLPAIAARLQPTTLSADDHLAELRWFATAARPYLGTTIEVLAEASPASDLDGGELRELFTALTGIRVVHTKASRDEVITAIDTLGAAGAPGPHAILLGEALVGQALADGSILPLATLQQSLPTSPTLALDDLLDGPIEDAAGAEVLVPSEEWLTALWIHRTYLETASFAQRFSARYGYNLGVPRTTRALEDLSSFFTNDIKEIDNRRVYGLGDFGERKEVGWSLLGDFTTLGVGDTSGAPVDGWGLAYDGCRVVGASVARGGAVNSPAARYALTRRIDHMKKYASPSASGQTEVASLADLANGNVVVARVSTSNLGALSTAGLPVVDAQGLPLWVLGPLPTSHYGVAPGFLRDRRGYAIATHGSVEQRAAAWLYAQFMSSRVVSLKKSLLTRSLTRTADLASAEVTAKAAAWGNLPQIYRGARASMVSVTAGLPEGGAIARAFAAAARLAYTGEATPSGALDQAATAIETALSAAPAGPCAPQLREPVAPSVHLDAPGSPHAAQPDPTGPQVMTPYADLLDAWD